MKKVQFFILLEVLILVMAFFSVLGNEGSRSILLFAVLLLLIRYFVGGKGVDFFLISAATLFLTVFILNPYFMLATLFFSIYMLVNLFSRYEKKNQYTHLVLDQLSVEAQRTKSRWFGNEDHSQNQVGFEDINVIRLFGNDIVDLDETVVLGRDNVVVIRKTFGKTKIIVPIDVEVFLQTASLYGQVQFLGSSSWDLRNEQVAVASPHYPEANKRVKIVVNCLFGDVEVVRV